MVWSSSSENHNLNPGLMIFHVLTIFPDFFRGPFEYGVVSRAVQTNKIQIRIMISGSGLLTVTGASTTGPSGAAKACS